MQYSLAGHSSSRWCQNTPTLAAHQEQARPRRLVVANAADGYKIIVVGGGAAGATVSAHYGRKFGKQVAVIEAADEHYYQPLWTLVGGGIRQLQDSVRPEADVLSQDVDWLKTSVKEFDPDRSTVTTADGRTLSYDYLVVATGMAANWNSVKGLASALGDGHVVSNYSPKYAPMTFQALKNLKKGHAIFTAPKGPLKCPGASQKACYLSDDYLRREGRRAGDVTVTFVTPAAKIMGLDRYLPTVEALTQQRDIKVLKNHVLVEVKGQQQQAVFDELGPDGQATGQQQVMQYDMLHVSPMHQPVEAVARSQLANEEGWVAVDKGTLQHVRYPNVFGIGDCCSVPTSKTAAAAAAQFLVLRDNLDALIAGQQPATQYDGYTSCPVVTKRGAVMMMEFGYDSKILEMFSRFGVDQSKEQYLMWLVKTLVLPYAYWNLMVKGYVPWREIPRMIEGAMARAGAAKE